LPVSFIATASDAEDGDLTPSISWSSDLDGALGTGGSLSLSSLRAGTHVITAAVADSLGAPDADTISVTIAPNADPVLTITSPVDGATITETLPVSFTATANDTEDGDLTPSISWSSDLDGALGTGGSLSLTTLQAGLHTISVSVTDSLGASDTRTLTLTIAPNTEPTLTVTAPADGYNSTEGASVSFAATASDAEDGDLTPSITWSSDLDGPLGAGGSLALTTLQAGAHTITVSVTDSLGASATRTLSLTIAPNAAPVLTISSPADGATITETLPVSFTATATDAEDGDLTAAISWSSDLDGALGTGGSL